MDVEQKSLKLAELMPNWSVDIPYGSTCAYAKEFEVVSDEKGDYVKEGRNLGVVRPYEDSRDGLAQFAAILLAFREVMWKFMPTHLDACDPPFFMKDPTQANILDEILRMNGVNPDA